MARRTKEDADVTRNRLLDAAESVFYEKGVAHSSLNEIAQTAGATRGAIYWHFKDKLDLFNAMMDRVTLPMEVVCDLQTESVLAEPLQRVRGLLQRLFSVFMDDAHTRRVFEIAMYRVEYVQELRGVRERHQAALERLHALLAADLTLAAQNAGLALSIPPQDAALGLQALFDGLLQAWMLSGVRFDLRGVGAGVVDAYLRGLGFKA